MDVNSAAVRRCSVFIDVGEIMRLPKGIEKHTATCKKYFNWSKKEK